jgi:serine/threonine-protein kinase RsbW
VGVVALAGKKRVLGMTSQAPTTGSVVVESKVSALGDVCKQIMECVKLKKFGEEDQFAVHLALEEAFNNAVEHGNQGDPGKTVQIDYSIDDRQIEIRMTDQGRGFDPHKVVDPRMEENLYEPRGRGLLLMNAYMDVVQYNPRGNSIHMVRFRHKGSRDPGH